MSSVRIAIAASDSAALDAAAGLLAERGAKVVARCASRDELLAAVKTAESDLIFADEAIFSDCADFGDLAGEAGPPVLPLAALLPAAWKPDAAGANAAVPDAAAPDQTSLFAADGLLRVIFDHAPLGISLVGMDDRIVAGNPALCRMMGYSAKDLCGKTITEVTYPDDRLHTRQAVERLSRGEMDGATLEKRNVDGKGRVFWVRATLALIRDASGAPLYRLGMVEDIDQEKRAAAEAQSRLAAQRDTLVREVHHRIRNNLQSVAGMLRRQLGPHPELSHALQTAISQVNTMAVAHGLKAGGENDSIRLGDLLAGVAAAAENVVERAFVLPPMDALADVELARDETVPLAVVLNELMLNALTHGRIDAGPPHARLSIARQASAVTLRLENAFDDPGGPIAHIGAPGGSGLKLVQAMLPPEGASLNWYRKAPAILVTELVLSPPVLCFAVPGQTTKESVP